VEKQLQKAEENAATQIVEIEQKEYVSITKCYIRTFAQYSAGLNKAILLL
ncbi:hypothetical protein BJX63DRAFT_416683, partial [Aspergillus granulosus]